MTFLQKGAKLAVCCAALEQHAHQLGRRVFRIGETYKYLQLMMLINQQQPVTSTNSIINLR